MNRYQNGKIYSIRSYQTDKVYIGSTCMPLAKRLYGHRQNYNRYGKGKFNFITSFEILEFNMSTALTDKIAEMIEPTIEGLGFELVRVQLFPSPRGEANTLQIMAEKEQPQEPEKTVYERDKTAPEPKVPDRPEGDGPRRPVI